MQDLNTKVLQAALALHDKVSSTFRKTAINFHYEFTVRHLANVFQVSGSSSRLAGPVGPAGRQWQAGGHVSEGALAKGVLACLLCVFPWPACRHLGKEEGEAACLVTPSLPSPPLPTGLDYMQGLLMSTPELFNNPAKWGKLWLHESERVYADRLVTLVDQETYNKAAVIIAKKYFNVNEIDDYYRKKDPKPLIFCHFARGLADKAYDEVSN